MKKSVILIMLIAVSIISVSHAKTNFESDTIKTQRGNLIMTFIGHGTLMFEYNGHIIHIDPVSRYADYTKMPKADVILLTHHHGDHLDMGVIKEIRREDTDIILTETCYETVKAGRILGNGDTTVVRGLPIEAVPAYNLVHKRKNGQPYHPKGNGNGYVIDCADVRVYIGGDTENIPEMKKLTNIDIAFLPMNLPYTMTPEMVVDAVNMFKPGILYPYHYGDTNVNDLLKLMEDVDDVEVRVRNLR